MSRLPWKRNGFVTLVNATSSDWNLVYHDSYHMKVWNGSFPTTIPSGTTARIAVRWSHSIFRSLSDDKAEARYQLAGTDLEFEVQAWHPDLQIYLKSLSTNQGSAGSNINLGFRPNADVFFVLAGNGPYTSGTLESFGHDGAWMHFNLPFLSNQTMRIMCMLGSHDAGMSTLSSSTFLVTKGTLVTQKNSIARQLELGSRFFDIRPCLAGGKFVAGHYDNTGNNVLKWLGGNGESISQIIESVNSYTSTHPELIIIDLSHGYNTDVGQPYRNLDAAEWSSCLEQFTDLKHRYVAPADDVTQVKLGEFIGKGEAAVVILLEDHPDGFDITPFQNQGFHAVPWTSDISSNPASVNYSNYFVNLYSDTDDVDKMAEDQLAKIGSYRSNPLNDPFLLSWTLTQSITDEILATIFRINTILGLGKKARSVLLQRVLPKVTKSLYPNVILLDGVEGYDATKLAIIISLLAASN